MAQTLRFFASALYFRCADLDGCRQEGWAGVHTMGPAALSAAAAFEFNLKLVLIIENH